MATPAGWPVELTCAQGREGIVGDINSI
jgi:hypothetical protein